MLDPFVLVYRSISDLMPRVPPVVFRCPIFLGWMWVVYRYRCLRRRLYSNYEPSPDLRGQFDGDGRKREVRGPVPRYPSVLAMICYSMRQGLDIGELELDIRT